MIGDLAAAVRRRPALAGFALTYLVGFGILGAVVGAELTVPYLLVVSLLMLTVVRLDARFDLGRPLLWALAVWGLAHMAGGVIPLDDDRTLYNAILGVDLIRYDRLVHAFGFGAATYACGVVMRRWIPAGSYDVAALGIVVLAGMGVGALNEMVEFIATLVLDDTNVGGFDNTGWDLVFDFAGALVAAGILSSSAWSRERVDEGP